jgi:ectoine hydroxylase-related dioxygenase (phytanoyl-CoA dioxygenase family)
MESSETTRSYEANGFVVIEGIVSSQEISQVLGIVNRLALSLIPPSMLNHGENPFLWLVRNRRCDAGHLFDCLVKIPEVSQILYSQTLQKLAEALLQTNLLLASPSQMNLRADHPGEEKFLYPWHHDYAYNCSARNSVVFWIPLHEVDEVNGCLHVIPGSHRLHAEINIKNATSGKNSAELFSVSNIGHILKHNPDVRVPMKAGSALALSGLLLHKSGANRSDHTRFAFQSRWFDGLAEEAVSNRWRGGIDEGRAPADYLLNAFPAHDAYEQVRGPNV